MMDLDNTEGPKSYVTYRNMETGETEEFESALLMEKMKDSLWAEQWEWESSRVIDPREIAAPGFSMIDLEGEDHAVDMLSDEEGLFIVTVHHLDKLNRKGLFEIRAALRLAEEKLEGLTIRKLTRGNPTMQAKFEEAHEPDNE